MRSNIPRSDTVNATGHLQDNFGSTRVFDFLFNSTSGQYDPHVSLLKKEVRYHISGNRNHINRYQKTFR